MHRLDRPCIWKKKTHLKLWLKTSNSNVINLWVKIVLASLGTYHGNNNQWVSGLKMYIPSHLKDICIV